MARFNELLAGRYNRFLQKLFVLKGGPPAPQLSSEIMPVFAFFSGAENRYLEGWDRFAVAPTQAAVATRRTTFQIRNPIGSNVIAVIERIIVLATGTADNVAINFDKAVVDQTDLATTNPSFGLDIRGRSASTCIVSNQAAAGTPRGNGPLLILAVGANQHQDFIITDIQELTLTPGTFYEVAMDTANLQMRCSFLWRERSTEESERT
jgi:hypothetical protein